MSSSMAKQFHSITIGSKNTWDHWRLVPTSRPTVSPPGVKTNIVDIPGADGSLDLTTVLTGRPMFNNRSGSWEFLIMNEMIDPDDTVEYATWCERYSEILNYLHGQRFKAILDDDPTYYYEGRFTVNGYRPGQNYSTITISYNVGPYKKSVSNSEDWEWDSFSFLNGIVPAYKNQTVNETLEMPVYSELNGDVPSIVVSIDVGETMTVTFNNITYDLVNGANVIDAIEFQNGTNVLTFTGKGMVSVYTAAGRL